jgi:hypothetical protein
MNHTKVKGVASADGKDSPSQPGKVIFSWVLGRLDRQAADLFLVRVPRCSAAPSEVVDVQSQHERNVPPQSGHTQASSSLQQIQRSLIAAQLAPMIWAYSQAALFSSLALSTVSSIWLPQRASIPPRRTPP